MNIKLYSGEKKIINLKEEKYLISMLNYYRSNMKMELFHFNKELFKSSYNHAKYINKNNIISHTENSDDNFFTGEHVSNRYIKVGGNNNYVGENFTYGLDKFNNSLDGLMTAIYHRNSLLSPNYNNIGIAQYNNAFVYNISNSYINKYCKNESKDIEEIQNIANKLMIKLNKK